MIGRAGGSRGKGSKQPKRKVPPFKTRSHRVTHATAKQMRARFVRKNARNKEAAQPAAYSRAIFDKILKQEGCVGIRLYPAIDRYGRQTSLIVGVDKNGDDILRGVIGDTPWLCPPYCSSSGLLQG